MCQLAQVSRAGYYRFLAEKAPVVADMAVRDAIQRACLAHRHYGSRRVTALLRRAGLAVNRKRVARLMREDNLLAVRRRQFVATTDSDHALRVYPNLARRLAVTATDQLWVADLTYIRLQAEFVYLAVVLDAFSRRVIGWALGRTLATRLPLAALEQALATRDMRPGLVHHSDRGVQYASAEYVAVLEAQGMLASMSRAANPYDNARCESFIGTLKREEIDGRAWASLEELERDVAAFLDGYYNRERLHSALGYVSPVEFEQQQAAAPPALRLPAALSFLRHEEIYPDALACVSPEAPRGASGHSSG